MHRKPQITPLSHYLRTGQKINGFRPDSYSPHDLCDLCGGTVYDLDIKSIRSERNARYQALLQDLNAAKRAGKTHKVWQSSTGPRTRSSHRNANGQTVKIDDRFRIGGETLFLPNDPGASLSETANCRCRVRYIGNRADDKKKKKEGVRKTRHNVITEAKKALKNKEPYGFYNKIGMYGYESNKCNKFVSDIADRSGAAMEKMLIKMAIYGLLLLGLSVTAGRK